MKVSICIPKYPMDNGDFLLERCLNSIKQQTFTDYEIVITEKGKMAENTNAAIDEARGDLIKILYMDDYFAHPQALGNMVNALSSKNKMWLATTCIHNYRNQLINPHIPYYSYSENTIGSPSVTMFRREVTERFDTRFSWVLDLDFYRRLFIKYGKPNVSKKINVVIGLHAGQYTNILPEEEKIKENILLEEKYQ